MRRGFTVVEVLVALVILGVALLGLVGTASVSARLLERAAYRESAAVAAASLLDSLLLEGEPTSGQRTLPRLRLDWTAEPRPPGVLVRLSVSGRGPHSGDSVQVEALYVTPPVRLEAAVP